MAIQFPINTRQLDLHTVTEEGDLDRTTSQNLIFYFIIDTFGKGYESIECGCLVDRIVSNDYTLCEHSKSNRCCSKSDRLYFACPIHKVAQKTGHVSPYKCSYRGRGFKSMAEVKRHLRNQHNAFIEKCSRCSCFFTDQQSLETHERMNTCRREGIHKGPGPQSRLWNSLFRAMFPDKAVPDNPCYHAGTPGLSAKMKFSLADLQEVSGSIQVSLHEQRAQQRREKVIQLIDKIRNNVISMEAEAVVGEESTVAKLLKSLPPLVEQTSSPTGIASSGMDAANIQNAPDNLEIRSGTEPSCATPSFLATDPFIFDGQLNDFVYDPQILDFTGLGSLEPC